MTVTVRPPITAPAPEADELPAIAARIGTEVAARHAADVDRWGRFPEETFAALRNERMLSLLVPKEHGGAGAPLTAVAKAVEVLAGHCGSSGLIYAMHHIQVACLVRHGNTPWLQDYLRTVAREDLLLASATTEMGTGGDVRSSICCVEPTDGDGFHVEKQAPVISYGVHSDSILLTARRGPDSPPNDQVLVVLPTTDCKLERIAVWNTLGFRGTCSDGFKLEASGQTGQILTDTYGDISSHTMLPTTHVLWASAWLGIARQAVSKARSHLRSQARKTPGTTPESARPVAELVGMLEQFAALVYGAAKDYDAALSDDAVLTSMGFAIRMNALKTTASQMVVDIVGKSLHTIGMAAYAEESPMSLGMALRDSYGAALMIHNDRIYGHTAQMLLVSKDG